jgi:hypothetical protein
LLAWFAADVRTAPDFISQNHPKRLSENLGTRIARCVSARTMF